MNNISNNLYSRNTYGTNNINVENNKIQNNIESKINIEQLSKIDGLNNKDVEKFIKRIHDEVQKAQLIAINIVRGNKITKDELEFITKKYPDLKQIADESIKDYKNLIKKLENCKTNEERQQVISKAVKEILNMVKNGHISEVQSKIKISAIEDAMKFSEKIKLEIEKAETIALKIIKGEKITPNEEKFINGKHSNINIEDAMKFSEKIKLEIEKAETIALKIIKGEKITPNEEKFINGKHSNIKQLLEETIKEIRDLKSDLKNCKTDQERNKLLINVINDLEDKNKKGLLSNTEIKIKMSAIEEVEKFLKKNQEEIKKLETIVMKIIKGQKLTKHEERFINEKYPYIKEEVQNEIKEYKYLEELKNYQNTDKKELILSNKLNELEEQIKKCEISETKARIKMEIIEEIKRENEEKGNTKEESLNYYINSYIYIFFNMLGDNLGIIIGIVLLISVIYF